MIIKTIKIFNKKRILAIIEIIVVILLFKLQILPHWSGQATTGDFLCLEIIAMLIYNIYDNLRNKI